MSEERILIIGGGIAGAATAWHLARRGAGPVVLLERERDLGAHATSQNAAILRTFTEEPTTTALAHETAALLADPPEGFTDVPLLDPKGLILQLGSDADSELSTWRESKPNPSTVRALDAAELSHRFPWYTGPSDGAWWVDDEGEIDVAALLESYLRGARAGGVDIRTETEVTSFLTENGGVRGVRLADGEELEAARVAVCAGGWAGTLAEEAGSRLRFEPRRRHLMVTSPDEAADPRWPILWSQPESFYTRPESGGLLLCICDEELVAPDECSVDPKMTERIAEKAARLVPLVTDAGCAHLWSGMRTFTSDDGFLIGPDPDVAGLHWVAALGGHGITCSAGVGRLAAAHLLGDAPDDAIASALDPRRFRITAAS
jgi:D-arginine dehydrogenase